MTVKETYHPPGLVRYYVSALLLYHQDCHGRVFYLMGEEWLPYMISGYVGKWFYLKQRSQVECGRCGARGLGWQVSRSVSI